jgi:hypothetical protein
LTAALVIMTRIISGDVELIAGAGLAGGNRSAALRESNLSADRRAHQNSGSKQWQCNGARSSRQQRRHTSAVDRFAGALPVSVFFWVPFSKGLFFEM